MKIIYFNYICGVNANPVGAIAKLTSYIRGLKELGYDVKVCWQGNYTKNSDSPESRIVVRKKWRRHLTPIVHEPKKLLMNIVQIFSMLRQIKEFQPDVVFERLEPFYFAAAFVAKLKKLPLVVEADAPIIYEYRNFWGKKNLHIPFISQFLEMYTLKRAEAIFCISNDMKAFYTKRGINPDKIFVTPNGSNPKMFFPMERKTSFVENMRLKGQTVVGWVGSLYGWAGTENLVNLVQELAEKYPKVSFLFVGGGMNEKIFKEKLHGKSFSDRVHIPGVVDHEAVNDYLSCMDIVLAPYPKIDFWWASSMKVFEYMGAGKAVVTSNVGQLNEVINHGENGLLYEAGDFNDLKEKVEQLIADQALCERVGKQAHKDVLANYTWEIIAKRMGSVFDRVHEAAGK